jgi:hypothetical protein
LSCSIDGVNQFEIRLRRHHPLAHHIRWLSLKEEFRQMYARAKEDQVQILADEIIPIADTVQMGQIVTVKADGTTERKVSDMIDRARLQIEARKWILAKLCPRKYGERIEVAPSSDPLVELLAEFRKEHERIGPPPERT